MINKSRTSKGSRMIDRGDGCKTETRITIGLALHDLIESFNYELWSGVEAVAVKEDINLICFAGGEINSPYHRQVKRNVIYNLIDTENVDGLVLAANILSNFIGVKKFQEYCRRFSPLPLASIGVEMEGIPSVILDNFTGVKKIISHLIEVHNCRHIAYIRGPATNKESEYRFLGYQQALEEHNIPFDPSITGIGNFRYVEGFEVMNYFLDNNYNIDAVAGASDLMILGAQEALAKRGIKVPDDIALAGFDDVESARYSLHPLTTVKFPIYRMAKRATEMLIQLIKGEDAALLEHVPAEIMIRRSCGCFSEEINNAYIIEKNIIEKNPSPDVFPLIDNFIDVFPHHFDALAVKMGKIIGKKIPGVEDGWEHKLLHALYAELTGEKENNYYVSILDDILSKAFLYHKDGAVWNNMFSLLRGYILPYIKEKPDIFLKAENLFYQSGILLKDMTQNTQALHRLRSLRHSMNLQFTSGLIISTYDLSSLLTIMARDFPVLGIQSCYLSVYKDRSTLSDKACIILAYNESGRINLDGGEYEFPSKQLIPRDIISLDRRYSMVVEALFSQDKQLGFILFEMDLKEGTLNETLRDQISSALKGSMLMREVIEKDNKLEKAHDALALRAQQLEEAIDQLQENHERLLIAEKMASLGRLTAGIAHEMNTPLASFRANLKILDQLIDEYSQSIEDPHVLPEDHRAIVNDMRTALKTAEKAASRSAGFIRGIKAQTLDRKSALKQRFNAASIIRDTLYIIQYALKKGKSVLETDMDEAVILFGNPQWLSEIVTNIVINGIEACKPDGGNISIIMKKKGKGHVQLLFKDSGKGIDSQNITRIFDHLYTTKPFGEGTGLGLSIVHNLVEEFDGSITVASKPGETIFTIVLPRVQDGESEE
jgi:DNA-binding LacI/PurR family transcriptional regulator/signal transduction histidine kinase